MACTWSPRISKSLTSVNRSCTEGTLWAASGGSQPLILGQTRAIPQSGRRFVRGEIALPAEDTRVLQVRPGQLDLDFAPLAVLRRVGRGETKAVLRANLRD